MKKYSWLFIMIFIVAAGCSSSKITSSWKAADTVQKKYYKIMVLGLTRDNDRSLQENMENHMVGDLETLGYTAVSSFKEYGPKAFYKMDEETALEKLKNSGVDAVMTIVLLDKQKEKRFVPGRVGYTRTDYYNGFWRYRTALYTRIYEPGYYVTDTKYFWESNFYDLNEPKLVYSVQTESFDPASTEAMAHGYGRMIIKDMVKKEVIYANGKSLPKAF